jgi:DNA-binding NarL/FixJ family response regulator
MPHTKPLPPLPLPPARWATVVAQLELSGQQSRVAELVIRGLGDKEIAAELGLSMGTVRTYISRLFVRLNVTDRVGLVIQLFVRAMSFDEGTTCHRDH